MSAVTSIAVLLALAAAVKAVEGLFVRLKAIKALHTLAENETRCGTAEAKTRCAIAFGDMITRVAIERRTTVAQWVGLLIRPQSRAEVSESRQDPQQPKSLK